MSPQPRPATIAGTVVPWLLALLASACATTVPAPGLLEILDRGAERALLDGMRAYDEGQYPAAEAALRKALSLSLRHPRDRAAAHKLLAFMQCTSDRIAGCEADFRAARSADPAFALTRAEAGHPLWGPVYRQLQR